jgi:hypothetical protein
LGGGITVLETSVLLSTRPGICRDLSVRGDGRFLPAPFPVPILCPDCTILVSFVEKIHRKENEVIALNQIVAAKITLFLFPILIFLPDIGIQQKIPTHSLSVRYETRLFSGCRRALDAHFFAGSTSPVPVSVTGPWMRSNRNTV